MAFALHPQNHDDETNRPSNFDMHRHHQLEILLDNSIMFLKGTGVDVEPAVLSGRVGLYLAESCSIKEVTLQFSGKARCASYDRYLTCLLSSLLLLTVSEWHRECIFCHICYLQPRMVFP